MAKHRSIGLHANNYRIAIALGWMLLFTVVAKMPAVVREIALAWRYGRGPLVDAYSLAFTLVTWVPTTLASVAIIVLVPTLVRMRSGSDAERRSFLAQLNGIAWLSGLALLCTVLVAGRQVLDWFAPDISAETQDAAVTMLWGFSPAALLLILVAIYSARLQANLDYRYTLAEGLVPFAVTICVLFSPVGGSAPLIVGTLFGVILATLWLARRAGKYEGASVGLSWRPSSEHWAGLLRLALIMGVGQFALSFAHPIDQYFVAALPTGELSTLNYVNRIIALGATMGTVVISRATLPIFSEVNTKKDFGRVHRQAANWSILVLVSSLLGTAIVWSLAPWVVAVMFERGAFTAADTESVAGALRVGIWQIPPLLSGMVCVSFLASQQRYLVISLTAVLTIIIKIIGNYFLTNPLHLDGVLFATVLMYTGSWFALLFISHRISYDA